MLLSQRSCITLYTLCLHLILANALPLAKIPGQRGRQARWPKLSSRQDGDLFVHWRSEKLMLFHVLAHEWRFWWVSHWTLTSCHPHRVVLMRMKWTTTTTNLAKLTGTRSEDKLKLINWANTAVMVLWSMWFTTLKCFFALGLFLWCSHVGPLSSNEGQKKDGSWHNVHFYTSATHTGCTHDIIHLLKMAVLTHILSAFMRWCLTNQTINDPTIRKSAASVLKKKKISFHKPDPWGFFTQVPFKQSTNEIMGD